MYILTYVDSFKEILLDEMYKNNGTASFTHIVSAITSLLKGE